MNGSVKSPSQEEARAALKALLGGSKAHAEDLNGQSKVTMNGVIDDGDKEQAGGALRSLFRAEFQKALRPPKAATRLAEIESQVSRLLDSVANSHPPDSPVKPAARAEVPEAASPAPRRPCAEAAMQTEVPSPTVRLEDFLKDEPPPEPPPRETPPAVKKRSLVVRADGPLGNQLRTQVQDARRRLFSLDKEVTSLTAQLKKLRSNVWNQQKRLCASEAEMAKVIRDRSHELPKDETDRDAQLQKEERRLAQELSEARAHAAKWSSLAKRQDSMLQQERDHQRGDANITLAKHPAGEVFFANFPPDADSEDGYDDGPRRPWQRGTSGNEDVSLGSSDEEDDDLRGGRARPPTLRSPLGLESEKDDESASASGERSSLPSPSGGDSVLPSPSGESVSMNSVSRSPAASSPAASPAAERAGQGSTFSSSHLGQTATEPISRVTRGRRSTSSSDTSDDDEDEPSQRGKLAMASLAGKAFAESAAKPKSPEAAAKSQSQSPQAAATVPPLPQAQLSSTTSRGRPLVQEDEAEEITSEEDWEADSSRSND